jgi:hypothetical protein
MDRIKDGYKFLITIFSEMLWLYYAIVMFTSIEWKRPVFFDLTWLIAAWVIGGAANLFIKKLRNKNLIFIVNILILGVIIFQNWIRIVPEGRWGFGIAVSIAIGLIYIRSLFMAGRQPSRQVILRKFEGNIIFYVLFAIIFTSYKWETDIFHLFFISAILGSLIGIIFTLQNYDDKDGVSNTKIIKVGQSVWFAGAVTVLVICIPLISLTLLMPSVNRGLYILAINLWEAIKLIGIKIGGFIGWLLSLMPLPDKLEPIPQMPNGQLEDFHEEIVEGTIPLPYKWIIGTGAILITLLALWFASRLLFNKRSSKTLKPKKVTIVREPWLYILRGKLRLFLKELKKKWRMSFSHYYLHPIFWYYHRVERWGRKKGLSRLRTETVKEYMGRLTEIIPHGEDEISIGAETYSIRNLLLKLSSEYQSVYYGQSKEIGGLEEYKLLITHLKGIR